MSSIKIVRTIDELQAWRRAIKDERARLGFVPTMGALHEGHAALLRQMRARCEIAALSIFVNPAQFGPSEDLAKYPRDFEKDLEIAAREKVDVVFAPTPEMMYPKGFSTYVEEQELSRPLCGEFRPAHFRGVTTVVLKLLNLVRPHLAFFGLKDAQQFFVLSKMARDLNLDVQIKGVATVREPDGLAMSSRNAYLKPIERQAAPAIYETLRETAESLRSGHEVVAVLAQARRRLFERGFQVQYYECLSLPSLTPTAEFAWDQPHLIATAALLDGTRLIDNVILHPEQLARFGIELEHDPVV